MRVGPYSNKTGVLLRKKELLGRNTQRTVLLGTEGGDTHVQAKGGSLRRTQPSQHLILAF